MPKRKLKNTEAGKRAIAGARTGAGGIANPDGTRSSVRTATFDIPGKRKGVTDVMLAPTICKNAATGSLERLRPKEAAARALSSGDYVRIKGGRTEAAIERARAKGDRKSQKFSAKLGKISKRSKAR